MLQCEPHEKRPGIVCHMHMSLLSHTHLLKFLFLGFGAVVHRMTERAKAKLNKTKVSFADGEANACGHGANGTDRKATSCCNYVAAAGGNDVQVPKFENSSSWCQSRRGHFDSKAKHCDHGTGKTGNERWLQEEPVSCHFIEHLRERQRTEAPTSTHCWTRRPEKHPYGKRCFSHGLAFSWRVVQKNILFMYVFAH